MVSSIQYCLGGLSGEELNYWRWALELKSFSHFQFALSASCLQCEVRALRIWFLLPCLVPAAKPPHHDGLSPSGTITSKIKTLLISFLVTIFYHSNRKTPNTPFQRKVSDPEHQLRSGASARFCMGPSTLATACLFQQDSGRKLISIF